MNNIESSVKPSFFDKRISDIDTHYHSQFSKLCAHLIKSSGKASRFNEMANLYIEIAEMKKAFGDGFTVLKQDIFNRHLRPASLYNLKCFRKRTNNLWRLMHANRDMLMNTPSNHEDIVEEFINLFNGEYSDYLEKNEPLTANIQNTHYEMITELTSMSHASLVTTA